jgi:hypothetical protein
MDERTPPEPSQPSPPVERVERHEVVERQSGPARYDSPARGAAVPMWAWLIPLVLLVAVLIWFIFTRGEPRSPGDMINLDPGASGRRAPATEVTLPRIEAPTVQQPEVRVPAEPAEPAAAPAAEAEPAEPPPPP